MSKRYVCVHGHFYQPPRENPWLEMIEVQDSASPYHDWNERINRECYAPNTVSRILNGGGRLKEIVNNFEKISFNVGPTLFGWLEKRDPLTYGRIIAADKASAHRRGGHGSALAQAYNHMIMPLASEHDKKTQILWGIADFAHRFDRPPEGMWLPETAVDKRTLQLMSEAGVKFTILCQRQAASVKERGEKEWKNPASAIDPSRAYTCPLDGEGSISVFFYDGPISQAVAFEGILSSADRFVERIRGGFSDHRTWPQLVNIATDGESYGHHHKFGDMTLAYALHHFEQAHDTVLTNYGEFLDLYPPEAEVHIHENSAWSCAHGVERWKSDCGCRIGGNPGWNQKWRTPLREALDSLKKKLDEVFEMEGKAVFTDPWEARNGYIKVILDRREADRFLAMASGRELSREEKIKALKLLEMQRHGMLMFTSCGWFFDDVSGIETVQILKYACWAMQLCEEVSGVRCEDEFLETLSLAKSNVTVHGDAAQIYQRHVRPDKATLGRVVANYSISKALGQDTQPTMGEAFRITEHGHAGEEHGDNALFLQRARAESLITLEESWFLVATLKLGGTDISCFVKPDGEELAFGTAVTRLFAAWNRRPITEVIRMLDEMFGHGQTYTLKDLFVEQRRKTVSGIMAGQVSRFADTYKSLFWENRRLMDYFIDIGVPIPMELKLVAQYILEKETLSIAADIESQDSLDKLGDIMWDMQKWGIEVELMAVKKELETRLLGRLKETLEKRDLRGVAAITRILLGLTSSGLSIDVWSLQNIFAEIYAERSRKPADPFYGSRELKKLGILLSFAQEEPRGA
ncbi:MAG: DUF3536 domain-containing protein [Nitrospinae bacterium]|nr:DUF3536 domain-containing protein [Nitrospinota bacterium]